MKTYRHLYPQVYAFENLHAAYRAARKGKRGRVPAATFEFNLEGNLIRLEQELRTRTYRPGAYHSFHIHEPKRRRAQPSPPPVNPPRLAVNSLVDTSRLFGITTRS